MVDWWNQIISFLTRINRSGDTTDSLGQRQIYCTCSSVRLDWNRWQRGHQIEYLKCKLLCTIIICKIIYNQSSESEGVVCHVWPD